MKCVLWLRRNCYYGLFRNFISCVVPCPKELNCCVWEREQKPIKEKKGLRDRFSYWNGFIWQVWQGDYCSYPNWPTSFHLPNRNSPSIKLSTLQVLPRENYSVIKKCSLLISIVIIIMDNNLNCIPRPRLNSNRFVLQNETENYWLHFGEISRSDKKSAAGILISANRIVIGFFFN